MKPEFLCTDFILSLLASQPLRYPRINEENLNYPIIIGSGMKANWAQGPAY